MISGLSQIAGHLLVLESWLWGGKTSTQLGDGMCWTWGEGQPGPGQRPGPQGRVPAQLLPHPAVGFAVGRVYADGSLAVLHGPGIVAEFAVGRSSGETNQGGQRATSLASCPGGAVWGQASVYPSNHMYIRTYIHMYVLHG